VQFLERLDTLFARNGSHAPRLQLVGEQHGGGFRQPMQPRLELPVFERNDQDPAGGRLRRGEMRPEHAERAESHDMRPDHGQ
jgi:hypothetical protein